MSYYDLNDLVRIEKRRLYWDKSSNKISEDRKYLHSLCKHSSFKQTQKSNIVQLSNWRIVDKDLLAEEDSLIEHAYKLLSQYIQSCKSENEIFAPISLDLYHQMQTKANNLAIDNISKEDILKYLKILIVLQQEILDWQEGKNKSRQQQDKVAIPLITTMSFLITNSAASLMSMFSNSISNYFLSVNESEYIGSLWYEKTILKMLKSIEI